MATQKSETKTDRNGVRPGVVHLALDVADRGQSTALAVLQDARIELRTAVDGGIDFAEKLATGALRFARKLVQKVDDAGADALTGAERALGKAIQNAHNTAEVGKELAQNAVARVTERSTAKA
jgi:hypothetical protein